MNRRFQEKYSRVPDHNAFKGYIGVHLLKAAVQRVGSWDQAKVRACLHDNFFTTAEEPGLLMDVWVNDKGGVDRPSFIVEIKDQKSVLAKPVPAPDVDLIVVGVRVPGHRDLVMAGLQAGKAVFCEWPLGKNLAEAEEMAGLASQRSIKSIVGLQARSAPAILYARDLVREGYIGDVLTASLTCVVQAQLQRGPGRIWQGVRANGANVLPITGGHAIDALCAVLGEFAEVSARVSTRIPEWRTLEGKAVPVDSPDSINVVGRMVSRAEVSISVATAPSNPSGNRLEIYGRDGAIVIRANGALSLGPNQMHAGKGKEPLAAMPVPDKYRFAPNGTPAGQPYNVAQAYARAAGALRGRGSFDVDFDLAVQRHKLIDAIERSSASGRSVKLGQ